MWNLILSLLKSQTIQKMKLLVNEGQNFFWNSCIRLLFDQAIEEHFQVLCTTDCEASQLPTQSSSNKVFSKNLFNLSKAYYFYHNFSAV